MNTRHMFPIVLGALVLGLGFSHAAYAGEPIDGVDVSLGKNSGWLAASADPDTGTLPTHYFYFLKQWGRGIERMLTTDPVAKAELELRIANQVAGELIAVDKANPMDARALTKALETFADAEEKLRFRITTINGTANARFLKDVDAQTVTHTVLLERLSQEHPALVVEDAQLQLQKTFSVSGSGVPTGTMTFKSIAASAIAHAGASIKQVETSVFGQEVIFTATAVPPPTGSDTPSIVIGFAVARPAEFLVAPVNGVDDPSADGNQPLRSVSTVTGVDDSSPDGPQSLRGQPIPGVDVNLGKNPADIIVATTTSGADGSFAFVKLAPGRYNLTVGDQRIIALTVGSDGMIEGSVGKGIINREDSSIFDRWGNAIAFTANAKGRLASANTAFTAGNFAEAYGLARSAEAMLAGIHVAAGDVNGDGLEEKRVPSAPTKALPTIVPNPTPINDAPKTAPSSPTPVASSTPVVSSTPEKVEDPAPATTRPVPPVEVPKGKQ